MDLKKYYLNIVLLAQKKYLVQHIEAGIGILICIFQNCGITKEKHYIT